jgi:hypothetical protein
MVDIANLLTNPLLAQSTGPSSSLCWAIVLLCVILGVSVACRPPKRTVEVKKRGE